jgi:hypothetical protein
MIPASIRNNNPGALYTGPSACKFGATGKEILVSRDGKHQIAKFPTAIHGAAALFDNLMNAKGAGGYYYRGRNLGKAIETWCGAIRAQTYLAVIRQRTGLVPGSMLSEDFLRDPDRVIPLAQAMAYHEAGREFPGLEPNDWLEAHSMAFAGGHVAPEPLPTNDVPTMRPEMRAAQKIETAVATTKMVAGGGALVAGGVKAVAEVTAPSPAPALPVPPAPDLSALSEWQVVIQTGKSLTLFAYSHILWIGAAAALYWLACHYWPKRSA